MRDNLNAGRRKVKAGGLASVIHRKPESGMTIASLALLGSNFPFLLRELRKSHLTPFLHINKGKASLVRRFQSWDIWCSWCSKAPKASR